MLSLPVFGSKVRELGCRWAPAFRQRAAADNAQMETLIRNARQVRTAVVGAAVAMVMMATAAAPAASAPVQTQAHALDGHRVTLDVSRLPARCAGLRSFRTASRAAVARWRAMRRHWPIPACRC